MKGPYQIRRELTHEGYMHRLFKFDKGKPVIELARVETSSPIAPKWLRDKQALLNTTVVMSKIGA